MNQPEDGNLGYAWLVAQYQLRAMPLMLRSRLESRVRGRKAQTRGHETIQLFEPKTVGDSNPAPESIAKRRGQHLVIRRPGVGRVDRSYGVPGETDGAVGLWTVAERAEIREVSDCVLPSLIRLVVLRRGALVEVIDDLAGA